MKITKDIVSYIQVNALRGLGRVRIQRMLEERGIKISHGSVTRFIKTAPQLAQLHGVLESCMTEPGILREFSEITQEFIDVILEFSQNETTETDKIRFAVVLNEYTRTFLMVMWYYRGVDLIEGGSTLEKLTRISELVETYIAYLNIQIGTSYRFNWRERWNALYESWRNMAIAKVFLDVEGELIDVEKTRERAEKQIKVFKGMLKRFLKRSSHKMA